MDKVTKEQILKVMDQIEAPGNKEVALITNAKSVFKILKEAFPRTNVILIQNNPQNNLFKGNTVYIIPIEKPIKIIKESIDDE